MLETIVGYFWMALLAYAAAGLLFGVPFVFFWAGRVDVAAQAGSWGFRLAILPGVIALWPLMLAKTLRSRRDRQAPPDAERFCAAGTLRRMHGVAFSVIVVLVPLICGVAFLTRPNEERSVVKQLAPAMLAEPVPLAASRPGNLPIEVSMRTDGRHFQVQLDVAQPLGDPLVALYWSSGSHSERVGNDAVFLGSVWGPARLVFPLPDEAERIPGALTFITLAVEQRVVGTLSLNRK